MSTLTLNLPKVDADRLTEIAARQGISMADAAAAAVTAQLDADAAARAEIEAGLGELDAGQGLSLDAYERELDAFLKQLPPARG
jgi:predicted transcriptional regulator